MVRVDINEGSGKLKTLMKYLHDESTVRRPSSSISMANWNRGTSFSGTPE